jgi:hypothetical protein
MEDYPIFSVICNVPCHRVVNFESKLTLNLDESVQQFRERQRMHSFLLRMMLDCLECVHQFK